ncbi:MAG: DUF4399 domain-containing protein [Candidatus Limnocylindria bacterium]
MLRNQVDWKGMHTGSGARVFLVTAVVLALAACADGTGGTGGVSFAEPADGATVSSPVRLVMQSQEVTIEPAGEVQEGAGHFHVMVDVGCMEPGEVIPADDDHLHFGDGSTETSIELEPGEHTLCLQVGDGVHTALDATHEITVTVE